MYQPHHTAAYTQYVWPLKVASEVGCCRSHSLMLSSQLPLRNTFRRTVFQFNEYTCHIPDRLLDTDTC